MVKSALSWSGWSFENRAGLDQERMLSGTVVVPPNTGRALEMLVQACQGAFIPPERTTTVPVAFPALDMLAVAHSGKTKTLAAGI